MRLLTWLAVTAFLVGCANPPDRRPNPLPGSDWLVAAQVGCTVLPEEEVLEQAAGPGGDVGFIRRISALETTLTRRPLIAGNRITLLIDGPETHAAQLAAIADAAHHVHLEVYIITDDEVGTAYKNTLIAAVQRGVKVRLLFDSIGGLGVSTRYLRELRAAGVEVQEYNSINPLKNPLVWRVNRRDHRKLLIVDGKVAFTGGINITDEYLNDAGESDDNAPVGWRDTHVKVEGPAVAEMQRLFIRNWEDDHEPMEVGADYWPLLEPVGTDLVRIVTNGGADFIDVFTRTGKQVLKEVTGRKPKQRHAIYESYLAAIREASERVWITQAYFAPNRAFIDALRNAAARGVDVRLLVPGESDVPLLLNASRYYYAQLLAAGVKLYEYQGAMLHAKTAVIDGLWATVGSSNLDFRSFIHNDEANAVIMGHEFAQQLEKLFVEDIRRAHVIDAKTWSKRSWAERLRQRSAAMIKYWI